LSVLFLARLREDLGQFADWSGTVRYHHFFLGRPRFFTGIPTEAPFATPAIAKSSESSFAAADQSLQPTSA